MNIEHIKNLRLVLGAADLEDSHQPISDEYVDQVASARSTLDFMKGSEVIQALIDLRRSGLNIALDLRPTTRVRDEESKRRAGERY